MRLFPTSPFIIAALMYVATICGCSQDVQTTEFARAISPNRQWIAKAIDERHFGPGTAGDVLRVTLQPVTGHSPPGDVLVLSPPETEAAPGHPSSHLRISWSGPTKVALGYCGGRGCLDRDLRWISGISAG